MEHEKMSKPVVISIPTTRETTKEELDEMHEKVIKFHQEVQDELRRPFAQTNPKAPKIVYCMNFYHERIAQVIKCLIRVLPYVDKCVLVYDSTVSDGDKTKILCALPAGEIPPLPDKLNFFYREWDDQFSKQRNAYLDHVNEGEWVIVSDPDELFSASFVHDAREILYDADKRGINIIGINAHDVTKELDGKTTKAISNWFKQLIFKYEDGVRYAGKVHETLLPGVHGWRPANLDRRYYYTHFKSMLEVKERGARNVYCGGGGNNVLTQNPLYVQWHEWTKQHNVYDWPQMRAYIRVGHIEGDLKQLFIDHRNDSGWDYENESRDPFLWYKALFPDEMKDWESTPQPPSQGSPPEVMHYVEQQYREILGRDADTIGKNNYTQMIIDGRIPREELPNILKSSPEYKEKHPEAQPQ